MDKFERVVNDIVAAVADFAEPDLQTFQDAVWIDGIYFNNCGLSLDEFEKAIEEAWKRHMGAAALA